MSVRCMRWHRTHPELPAHAAHWHQLSASTNISMPALS